ncbi:MEMBER OF 'GDXG' FAMILY OF LIPOLYTIC ENZYMES [Ceraceosorus bombacis]|uniref:MEMBER OF 'GDXG' FAMILY OF LIPOLYTIC ENZYMES n=1 Tax=Ceraceosorus bombacis TaxID=401625 RepID=A0A0P1BHL0_9BASI|nr:MEMBER OF 'GDXG' FAMILY OF LIPOLYTIC ENZYMES [Ceraceosorus bombacis]
MASGERVTLTYTRRPSGPLHVDLSPFTPPVRVNDPSSSKPQPLPFVLYLHGGNFLSGSRHDVPAWLVQLCSARGFPLLCADYRLAPHAGPGAAWSDVQELWTFIREDLPWIVSAAGSGAEVESGTKPLDEAWEDLQRRGGLDHTRCIIFGAGAGGYLAALGGALLSPPPLSVIMAYPILSLPDAGSAPTASLHPVLRAAQAEDEKRAAHTSPELPALLDKSPHVVAARAEVSMDIRRPWRGEAEGLRRVGLAEALLQANALYPALRHWSLKALNPTKVISGTSLIAHAPVNEPYPPTFIFHGSADDFVPVDATIDFMSALRGSNSAAAALDDLLPDAGKGSSSKRKTKQGFKPDGRVEPTRRFASVIVEDAIHAFDALLTHEDTAHTEFISQLEQWLVHKVEDRSAQDASAVEFKEKL